MANRSLENCPFFPFLFFFPFWPIFPLYSHGGLRFEQCTPLVYSLQQSTSIKISEFSFIQSPRSLLNPRFSNGHLRRLLWLQALWLLVCGSCRFFAAIWISESSTSRYALLCLRREFWCLFYFPKRRRPFPHWRKPQIALQARRFTSRFRAM